MRTLKGFAVGAGLALLLTSCGAGSGNTEAEPGSDSTKAAAEGDFGNCSNADVLKAVDGLGIAEREAKLKELAAEEDKSVQIYASVGADDLEAILKGFKDKYGITVEVFSANSEEVLQRLSQEAKAGRTQADVVENNGTELELASMENLLAPISTPHSEPLPEEVVYPTWVGTRFNVFTVLHNPKEVPEAEVPRTYEDLADPKWNGRMGVEAGNWDLFATMVMHMKEQGKTEEEALAIWKDIITGSKVYTSNTPLAEAVESGELALGLTYNHYYSRFTGRGSESIEWQPAIEPQVLRPNGVGVPCEAPNPATATLLSDFFISEEGQQIFGDTSNRDVTSPNVNAGMLPGTDYEKIYVPLGKIIPSSDKWVPIYDEMIRNASN